MTAYAISGLLTGISSLSFGLFVLMRSSNKKLGFSWFLFALSVAGYGFGTVWAGQTATSQEGLLAWRVTYAIGVLWIAPLFYQFVNVFLERRRPILERSQFAVAGALLFLLPTPLFFESAEPLFKGFFYAQGGLLYPLFFAWWMGLVVYAHWLLIKAYPTLAVNKRLQVNYFVLGTGVGFFGGSLCYLGNFGIPVYPLTNFLVCLYPVIMATAIVKHRLLGVTVIIRKTLVYSAVTLILTVIYVSILVLIAEGLKGSLVAPNALSQAISAGVIAVLFHPVRLRIQRSVDRYFPREALDQQLLQEATSLFVHELKRPLMGISLPAQLALKDLEESSVGDAPLKARLMSRLGFVVSRADDLGHLVDALRELSSDHPQRMEEVDLREVLTESLKAERDSFAKEQIEFDLNLPSEAVTVKGKAALLRLVFRNLLKNSCEAIQAKGGEEDKLVSIRASAVDSSAVIEVSDNGIGLSPEQVGRMFEARFTTKGASGMGIGLYLAQQIMQQHGGRMAAHSVPGQGLRMTIELPLASNE
jgi:signal transduction histidine kinase